MTKFTLHSVQGKHRPRFTRQGRCYPEKADVTYEKMVASEYLFAGGYLIKENPVTVKITVYRPLQKKYPKRIISVPDTFKPDVDNISKIILDGLNGVAYSDDKQVTRLEVYKSNRYRDQIERVEVEVSEVVAF